MKVLHIFAVTRSNFINKEEMIFSRVRITYEALRLLPFAIFLFRRTLRSSTSNISSIEISSEFAFKNAMTFAVFDDEFFFMVGI